MPTKHYAFRKGEKARVTASWEGNWKELKLAVDGQRVAEFADYRELTNGRAIALPDGSTLWAGSGRRKGKSRLLLVRDGRPMPGAGLDLQNRVTTAAAVAFFVAAVNGLCGAAVALAHAKVLEAMGFNAWMLADAAVYALLGLFIWRRSMVALVIAIGLFSLDGALQLIGIFREGHTTLVGIIYRVLMISAMCSAIPALLELKRIARKQAAAATAPEPVAD